MSVISFGLPHLLCMLVEKRDENGIVAQIPPVSVLTIVSSKNHAKKCVNLCQHGLCSRDTVLRDPCFCVCSSWASFLVCSRKRKSGWVFSTCTLLFWLSSSAMFSDVRTVFLSKMPAPTLPELFLSPCTDSGRRKPGELSSS
jgi:hypothetical protein